MTSQKLLLTKLKSVYFNGKRSYNLTVFYKNNIIF
uniref:Uncharacterized protein n=1 Tax=Myoviridae sp. ct6F13 TaxID=2827602 RepID=A0A8S5LJI2_9CAUD|nr:MAG TPA: hypothetical protein [Myoviridae sp. ct6F13]